MKGLFSFRIGYRESKGIRVKIRIKMLFTRLPFLIHNFSVEVLVQPLTFVLPFKKTELLKLMMNFNLAKVAKVFEDGFFV